MKRILSILTAVAILLTLTACGSKNKNADNSNASTEPTKSNIVDENLLTVDITIPASMFSEENPATDKLTQKQIDYGFKSAKINDDGSVTYTMSKSAFNKYKKDLKANTESYLNSLNKDFPSVTSVEFNDDFSEIKINVNRTEYKNNMDFMCITAAGLNANFYQAYTNEKIITNISTIDDSTGEVIDSATYPTK